jgi:hypothetical protein
MAVLDQVPLEDITARARQVEFGRVLLTLIAALLYGVGWLAAKVLGGIWLAFVWSAVAVKVGWTEARKSSTSGP